MSCRGVLPKLDAAIFADTQWEPKAVYAWLDTVLQPEAEKAGIPIHRVSKGNIRTDAIKSTMSGSRWASMPVYTFEDGATGQAMRQCTQEYKIDPINKKMREIAIGQHVELWFGISGDEMRRMRMSKVRWIAHYYPLVFAFDRPWHRYHCLEWLKEQGFPAAPRSACIGCPYRDNEQWRSLSQDEFLDAVMFDRMRKFGNMKAEGYLHRSCRPLESVDLETLEEKGQINWLNECEGMCGV